MELDEPEGHSQERYLDLKRTIEKRGDTMEHDGMHDKVEVKNIFEPGRGGSGGGSEWAAILPALMGERNSGFGGGAGGFGAGLLGGALFGGRRGGLFGGGDGGEGGAETRIEDTIFNTQVLSKLGTIEAAIPLGAAQTENVILQQTNQITNLASAAQLANQQGFSNTKDTIMNTGTVLLQGINQVNQNVLEQSCQTRAAIAADGDKTRALVTSIYQTTQAERINALNAEVIELREETRRSEAEARRVTDVNSLRSSIEINNTATATAAQQQQQFQVQSQFQNIGAVLANLAAGINNVTQIAHATNQNIIAGNTGAVTTAAQTASPTNVNTR